MARVLLCTLLIFALVLGTEKAEGVRLCGKRLADLLKFICEKHGGFHAPLLKRDGKHYSDSSLSSKSRVFPRSDIIPTFPESGEILSTWQKGVVDECCKKQCSLTTLVSYCANANYIGNIDIEDIMASLNEKIGAETQEPSKQESSKNIPEPTMQRVHSPYRPAYNRRPNLGLSNRDRSVFIVSPRLQEGEQALGDYRF